MRIISCFAIVGSALVLLSSAGFADDDLKNGQDLRQEVQAGVYDPHGTGNQTRVREYDGRTFPGFGIESYSAYGYNRGVQFRVDATDFMVGADESVHFLVSSNSVKFSGGTDMLTHRLVGTPAINPWVARQMAGITPAPTAMVLGRSWDTFKDLNPGSQYYLGRRVDELNLYVNADPNQRVGLLAGWWQEQEQGQQQLEFRARATKAGVINSGDRGSVALPIDRETNETKVGTDIAIGSDSVVNVQYTDLNLSDNSPRPTAGSRLDFLPLNSLNRVSNDTQSRVVKARTNITDRLQFTGVQIDRERSNTSNNVPTGYNGAGSAMNKRMKTNSTNLGLVYRATDSLSITGRWRHLGTDNLVPPIFSGTSTTPSNLQLSTDTQSMELEGVYTGLSRAYMRFGYERRDTDKTNSSLAPGEADLEVPFTSATTNWNIWRTALRYHPIMRLNLSGNYENWNANNSGFAGAANNRTKTNLNATYMVRDNMAIYGDYSKANESNSEIRVDGAIPVNPANAAETAIREEAAGQGLDTRLTTTSIGTWYSVSDRLVLDASYGGVSMNSSTLWIIGADSAYLPNLPAQVVPFTSKDRQWTTNANYTVNSKLRVHGGFFHSTSDGASRVDPASFGKLGPEWTPFKVTQNRWSVGCSYGLSQKDCLKLDYSIGKWVDDVDSGNTGTYQLYRVAWARQL